MDECVHLTDWYCMVFERPCDKETCNEFCCEFEREKENETEGE